MIHFHFKRNLLTLYFPDGPTVTVMPLLGSDRIAPGEIPFTRG